MGVLGVELGFSGIADVLFTAEPSPGLAEILFKSFLIS